VDNLTNALEASGQAAKAKDVGTAVKAAGDLWKHVESLTGVDVAKAVAVKQAAPKEGETITAFDGVAALIAIPIASQ
jgi:hypothetical protein